MRDPKRIEPTLEHIKQLWLKNSDMRLMQLLGNCFTRDPYFVEDDDLLEALAKTYPDKEAV